LRTETCAAHSGLCLCVESRSEGRPGTAKAGAGAALLGLLLENLILKNRRAVWDCLRISADEIVFENPY
jgi:hypothetical protein